MLTLQIYKTIATNANNSDLDLSASRAKTIISDRQVCIARARIMFGPVAGQSHSHRVRSIRAPIV